MLILLPLDKRLDWKKPPLVTIFLIVINCLIFFVLQSGDEQIRQDATDFYVKSGLAEMEIPIYRNYLQATKSFEKLSQFDNFADAFATNRAYRKSIAPYAAIFIDIDYEYYLALKNNNIPDLNPSTIQRLKNKRQVYLAKYQDSIYRTYSLRPAVTTIQGIYGHMFLHANFGHLFGNMMMLFIVGFVVEAVLGGRLYLVAYILTGLGSAALDIAIQSNSFNFHLGASGAIAGVMGMYAALFGFRKIQFFYNILFWVDRLKAPAIIMLFAWLSNELLQLAFVDSNVNYLAHVGGLISGAIIAMILTYSKEQINTAYMDAPIKEEQYQQQMSMALQSLGEMKNHKAKFHFQKALNVKPDSIQTIEHLLHLAEEEDHAADYQKYSQQLIEHQIQQELFEQMFKTYENFLNKKKAPLQLSDQNNFIVIKHLIKLKRYQQAEQLIIPMFKHDNSHPQYPGLFFILAKQRLSQGDKKAAYTLLKLVIKYFPQTEEAKVAAQLI